MAETKEEIIINDLELHKITESRRKILPHIINSNTDEVHRKNVNCVRNFLVSIGHYRSIIITLVHLTVAMHPPMDPTSASSRVDWKYGEKNNLCTMIKMKSFVIHVEVNKGACITQELIKYYIMEIQ